MNSCSCTDVSSLWTYLQKRESGWSGCFSGSDNKHDADTPALQEYDCRVHRAKSVCDSFDKYDGTLGPESKNTTPQSRRERVRIIWNGNNTTDRKTEAV